MGPRPNDSVYNLFFDRLTKGLADRGRMGGRYLSLTVARR